MKDAMNQQSIDMQQYVYQRDAELGQVISPTTGNKLTLPEISKQLQKDVEYKFKDVFAARAGKGDEPDQDVSSYNSFVETDAAPITSGKTTSKMTFVTLPKDLQSAGLSVINVGGITKEQYVTSLQKMGKI